MGASVNLVSSVHACPPMDYSSSAATLKNKAHTPGCRTGVAKLRRWGNDRC